MRQTVSKLLHSIVDYECSPGPNLAHASLYRTAVGVVDYRRVSVERYGLGRAEEYQGRGVLEVVPSVLPPLTRWRLSGLIA